ncbi:MAG: leishmanolysin-related zinc metalloendopeptidase [Gemmatimonadaceae bacterium]
MFKRTTATVKFLARIAVVLVCVACGDKPVAPVVPIEVPVVVPPTLTPGTAQVFDADLNSVVIVAPFITVKDKNGIGVANAWVKWTATSGKVDNDSSLTDGNGRANAGNWTLGTVSGIQTVTARTAGVSVIAMTANVAPGPFVGFVSASPTISGVVGADVATPPSVKAVDKYGNGVPHIFLQFAVWTGGGTITGNQQTTNDNGIATVSSWKLGPKSGTQSLRADDSRTGATTMVFANASAAPASQFVAIDGNAQSGQADKRLCTSPLIAVRDQFGNGIGGIPIVFTPGPGSGAVTDGSVVSSAGTGYALLGAWTLSGSATQTLIVTSPSLPGVSLTLTASVAPPASFSVCVRFLGDGVTPRLRQGVATAVQRWQRVIVGHVQTSPLNEVASRCFPGAPAINEVVEDLLVFVQLTTLDGPGNVVARAAPCTTHLPVGLTQMGLLLLDSADTDLLVAQGILDNVVTHELGHVLGVGTHWTSHNLLVGAGTDDPFFTGPSARAQFAQLFPSYTGNAVPVENIGNPGTRDAHWRASVFANELMQGYFTQNMPLSKVTVGSLGDLGYTVDLTKAEAFPFIGVLRTSALRSTELANDIADTEIWGVENSGRRLLVRAARNPFARK